MNQFVTAGTMRLNAVLLNVLSADEKCSDSLEAEVISWTTKQDHEILKIQCA